MLVTDKEVFHEAQIEYLFSLYDATFKLTKASQYSAIVRLTQKGGLIATYYETTDFLAPINDLSSISHTTAEYFTQLDAMIDLDLGDAPVTL